MPSIENCCVFVVVHERVVAPPIGTLADNEQVGLSATGAARAANGAIAATNMKRSGRIEASDCMGYIVAHSIAKRSKRRTGTLWGYPFRMLYKLPQLLLLTNAAIPR